MHLSNEALDLAAGMYLALVAVGVTRYIAGLTLRACSLAWYEFKLRQRKEGR